MIIKLQNLFTLFVFEQIEIYIKWSDTTCYLSTIKNLNAFEYIEQIQTKNCGINKHRYDSKFETLT